MEIVRNDETGSEGNVLKSITLETISKIMQLGDIPEWLLVELLIRLPVKFVFRFKLVSKQWLSVITDPSFVRMYVSRASSMSSQLQQEPWTFISENMHVEGSGSSCLYFKHPGIFVLPYSCTELPHETKHEVCEVSNGLVLYDMIKEEVFVRGFNHYSICNPITGKCITLPRCDPCPFEAFSVGFLARVDNYVLTSYIVVHLELNFERSKLVRFEVFNSEIGYWKDFNVSIEEEIYVIEAAACELNGILHWVTSKHGILAYDPYHNPDCLSFIKTPDDVDLTRGGVLCLLDVHQGQLIYLESSIDHTHLGSGFGVWLLKDYSTGDWCMLHKVSSEDILNLEILSRPGQVLKLKCFHPFSSDIVYFGYMNSHDILVSYNFKTKTLEDHGGSLDIEDIVGRTRFVATKSWPDWWSTFLLLIPPWPIYIPAPFFGVVED